MLGNRDGYLSECADYYRRALVTDVYAEAEDLFDSHAYQKGALVIQMLCSILGEEIFWEGLRYYVKRHAWQAVETSQLRMAFETVSGLDLGLFFDQWVYHGGHPQLEVSWEWDAALGLVEVDVTQAQVVDDLTPIFVTPLDLRVTTAAGATDLRVELDELHDTFHLPATERPLLVQVDPEGWLVAEIELQQSVEYWQRQLSEVPAIWGRVVAAEALAEFFGEPAVLPALGRALRSDQSWHVRSAAAASLGELGTDGAFGELVRGVDDADARVRRDVASALGEFTTKSAATALERLIKNDPATHVVAAAVEALGCTQVEGTLRKLVAATKRASHRHAIESHAYSGMAALEVPAAISPLLDGCRAGVPWRARQEAIISLGRLANSLPEHRAEIRPHLLRLVGDSHFAARRAAVEALGESGDPEVLPTLRDLARNAYEPGLRSRARYGVSAILAAAESSFTDLEERLDQVEQANRELEEKLGKLSRE